MTDNDATFDILRTPAAGGQAIRGGAVRAAGYVVGLCLGVGTAVLLLRALGVEDFGRFIAVAAVLGIASTLTDAGLTAVGSRELALREPGLRREELVRVLLALRIGLTVLAVAGAIAFVLAAGYDRTMVLGTLLGGIGVLLVNVQATAMMPLGVELRLGAVTLVEVARQAVTLVVVAILVVAGSSLLAYFAVQIAVGAAVLAVTPALVGGVRSLRPSLDRVAARRLLREALPVAVAIAMNVLYLRMLVILVSLFEDNRETGLYGTAFRIFEMLLGLPTVALSVVLPLLAVAGAEDVQRLRYAFQRTMEVAVLVSFALTLATFVAATPAVRLIGGAEYAEAAPLLGVQAWALIPLFVGQVTGLVLLALHRQRALVTANAAAVAVVLVAGSLLVAAYGGTGAAVTAILAETALCGALVVVLAGSRRDIFPGLTFLWRPLSALAGGLAVALVPGPAGWVRVIITMAAFSAIALVVRALPYEVATALRRRDPGALP